MSFVRAYLRASTEEQDADRAKADLKRFAEERGLKIAAYYTENVSGASLKRKALFDLLEDSEEGDVLLVEQVDRLSRLSADDWETLKAQIAEKRVRVVALDLPTSWTSLTIKERVHNKGFDGDDLTDFMLNAINGMMLDMLAAIARKDYEDRRRRTAQGVAKAKAAGKFKGRQEDTERNEQIMRMLERGDSWASIIKVAKCSRSTLSRLRARLKERQAANAQP